MGTTNFNGTINQSDIIINGSANKLANAPDNKVQLLATKHGWGSAWWDESVDLSKDWSSEFLVNAFNGSGTSDGFTFAINGDPKGTSSLGDGGQNLGFFGYDTKGGVKNSYAVLFDMWTTGPVSLLGFSKSDASTIPSANINLPIGLSNNSYEVQISYSASRKVLSASVGGNTYEHIVDLQSVVGNSGYLGFTAANGGGTLDTDISNWTANASKFGNTPIIRGNSIYTIVDGPSWTQAEANSVKLGGHLVSINNSEESYFLKESGFLSFAHDSYEWKDGWDVHGGAWIGITRRGGNEWQWSSQQDYLYNNWNPGEPSGDGGGNEDAHIYTYGDSQGKWNDIPAGWSPLPGIAEIPFIRRGDSAYVIVQGPTWEEAEANAVKLGGHLVTINDAAENDWITSNLSGKNLFYPASDGSDYFRDSYWTGFKRNDKNFTWVDGTKFEYSNFGPGEPAYNGDYGEITLRAKGSWANKAGNWNDEAKNPHYGIAEIKLAPNNTPTGTPTLSGTFKVGSMLGIDPTPVQDADNFTGYTPEFKYSWEVSSNGTTWKPLPTTDASNPYKYYTLTTAEVGKQVRGVVSYLDGYGTNEQVWTSSSTTITIANNGNGTAASIIGSGAFQEGVILSAPVVTGDPDGNALNPNYSYQWFKGSTAISGATASTYAVPASGAGTYKVAVTYTDAKGFIATLDSPEQVVSTINSKVQSLSSTETPIRFQRGQDITVPINYSTSDGSKSTGLSFRVHYDSSLFSFNPSTGISNKTLADLFQIGAVQQDTGDFDGDASTDQYIPINIASISGVFPTGNQPTQLIDLTFKAADLPYDSITGLRTTLINFSIQEAAQGYGFTSTSATLIPLVNKFDIDVDGDGKVTALGDGLMIIRKMFGSAFAGDALTNKAMSPNATRTSAEIHQYIQDGINNGLLDVDKDGKTTALGDGLMIIRHLFGPAFAGDALTSKAISPNSPYFGNSDASSFVAGNIDTLRSLIA